MRTAFIIIIAAIIEITLLLFVYLNGDGNIPLYIFFYFIVSLLFIAGYLILTRLEKSGGSFRYMPWLIIMIGVVFRLTLLPANATTSPDIYRYIWEGKITYHGFNPYLVQPDSSIVANLKTADWNKVGFKHDRSLYPPASQYLFLLSYVIAGEGIWGLKILYLCFELLTMVFIMKLLHHCNKNPELVILYAWLPLPLFEYFVNGHIDAAGISMLILFLYFFKKGYIKLSAIFFAISVLSKFYPLVLLLLILRKAGLKNFIIFISIFGLVFLTAYIPFFTGDLSIGQQLMKYIRNWEFNGSFFNLFKVFSNSETAREICFVLLGITVAVISFKVKDFLKGAMLLLIAVIVFATTVYPWYLGWSAAVNPLFGLSSMLYLYLASNLSNFTPMAKVWKEYPGVLITEYLPFIILLFFNLRSVFFLSEKKDNNSEKNSS